MASIFSSLIFRPTTLCQTPVSGPECEATGLGLISCPKNFGFAAGRLDDGGAKQSNAQVMNMTAIGHQETSMTMVLCAENQPWIAHQTPKYTMDPVMKSLAVTQWMAWFSDRKLVLVSSLASHLSHCKQIHEQHCCSFLCCKHGP
jgi:hypothetical protein